MAEKLDYIAIWKMVVAAIRVRIDEARREYGIDRQALTVDEQPARTVVILIRGEFAQARISLAGDSIEIRRQRQPQGKFTDREPDEAIEIKEEHGQVVYLYDENERTTDPARVAAWIVDPVIEHYRAA